MQLASKRDVYIDKYVEYLESVFEQLLHALDMNFDELVGRMRKPTPDTFFSK